MEHCRTGKCHYSVGDLTQLLAGLEAAGVSETARNSPWIVRAFYAPVKGLESDCGNIRATQWSTSCQPGEKISKKNERHKREEALDRIVALGVIVVQIKVRLYVMRILYRLVLFHNVVSRVVRYLNKHNVKIIIESIDVWTVRLATFCVQIKSNVFILWK